MRWHLDTREAGLAAALTLACCVQFVQVTRGAQIDATLVFWVTLALWAFGRHLLEAPRAAWVLLGGAAAGLGVIAKAVGFLALLIWPLLWLLSRRRAASGPPVRRMRCTSGCEVSARPQGSP